MVASFKNRMTRALVVALIPASLSFGLIGHSFAQAGSRIHSSLDTTASGAVADDDGPGLGGGYVAADDDGPGLGGGYCAAGAPGTIVMDGPGSSTPYVID
jgi:hypothetical protein